MYLLIFDHIKLIYRFVVKTGVHYGLDYAVYRRKEGRKVDKYGRSLVYRRKEGRKEGR